MVNQVVLSLGGNIGNVRNSINTAIHLIRNKLGDVTLISSNYTTKAWGLENQPDFLNKVVAVQTNLSPNEVLSVCLQIEKELGRDRNNQKKWAERVLDIDVLFYEDEIINSNDLVIPHPYLHKRNFVLYPLAEILPYFVHPILRKTVLELKKDCVDKLQVIKTLD